MAYSAYGREAVNRIAENFKILCSHIHAPLVLALNKSGEDMSSLWLKKGHHSSKALYPGAKETLFQRHFHFRFVGTGKLSSIETPRQPVCSIENIPRDLIEVK